LAVQDKDGTLRKIGGNSQARKRLSVLVHGTVLASLDFEAIAALLRFPSKVPDYRAGREHASFLTSLRTHGLSEEIESLVQGLLNHAATLQSPQSSDILLETLPRPAELERAKILLAEKYSRAEWNLRR
jgi:lipoate-protein ligase A